MKTEHKYRRKIHDSVSHKADKIITKYLSLSLSLSLNIESRDLHCRSPYKNVAYELVLTSLAVPVCHVCLTWIVSKMRGKWPQNFSFVGCCCQENRPHIILLKLNYKYEVESKVMHYLGNLCTLFFKLQQKQPSIQSRGHCVAPFKAIFLLILWSHADASSCTLKRRTPSL